MLWRHEDGRWRKLPLALAAVVLGVVLLSGAVLSGLLDRPLLWAVARISGYDLSCQVRSGRLFGTFSCRDAVLADKDGPFFTAQRLEFAWHPSRLLKADVSIARVMLQGASLLRLPQSESKSSTDADTLPSFDIRVNDLSIKHLVLFPRDPRSVCLDAAGMARIGPTGFAADLRAGRCSGPGALSLKSHYSKAGRFLSVDAKASDDGALIALFAGIANAGETRFSLNGQGPLSAFRGRLDFAAENVGHAQLAFLADADGATRVRGDYAVAPGLLPDWAPAEPGTLGLVITPLKTGIALRDGTLDWGGYALRFAGEQNADRLRGNLEFTAPSTLALGGAEIESLRLTAALSGTTARPRADLEIDTGATRYQTNGFAALTARAHVEYDGKGRAALAHMRGQLRGVQGPSSLAPWLSGNAAFDLSATLNLAQGTQTLTLTAENGNAKLNAGFQLARSAPGRGVVKLAVANLGGAGAKGGSLLLNANIAQLAANGDVIADLVVNGAGVTQPAFGPRPKLSAHLVGKGGAYRLSDLVIDTATAAVKGAFALGKDGALSGKFITSRGDIAPLSKMAGIPLQGRFQARATLAGNLKAPKLAADLTAPALVINQKPVSDLKFALNGQGRNGAFAGKGSLAAKTEIGAITLALNAQSDANGWKAVVENGALGPATLKGEVASRKGALTANLTLEGDVLAPAGYFANTTLAGRGRIQFTATGKAVHLAADLHDVAAPGLKQAKLVAKADAPALSGPYAIAADLADGANHVSAAAQLRLEKEMAVTLSRTAGIWAGQDFALTAPVTLRMADGAFTLDETRFALGKGSLVLAAKGGGENLTANVRLQSLPAGPVAALLGLGKAGGTISFNADVAVSKTESQGRFHFGANDLVFSGYKKDANKADIAADGSWNGQTLALNGKISGIGSEPATFDGSLPVVRTPGSYMPMLAKSGPVSFRARLRAPAENLMAVLPVAEHRLSGALDARIDVGGDIAQPAISGAVTVKDGVYENLEYGTRLTKLNAAFTARGTDQAALKLTASDGDDGTVAMDGNLRFGKGTEAEKAITGEGKLVLNNARLLREDALKARASGTITLALPPQGESKVSGTIRIDEVRADITGLMPPSIPFIEVVEINGKQVTPPEPAKPSMLNTIALDITVNMPNRVYVAGRGLDSEWQGDFHITGSLGAPKPSGKLTVVRGAAELIGKTFVLKSGSVVMDSEVKGGARVDLAAEYTSDDLVVKVTATGPAAKPELTWSSTPSLPRDEILSRLFFGKSSPHLSAFEALQLAQMSGQLDFMGGSSGGGLMGMARSVTGLDVLRVDTTPGASGLSGTSVAAGKYIGDNIYVGAVQGMGAGSSAVEVEVKINKHLSGKAQAGANSNNKLGVDWKWDY